MVGVGRWGVAWGYWPWWGKGGERSVLDGGDGKISRI